MAEKLKLTFACGPYDRTLPLKEGIVSPAGIDLEYLNIPAPRVIFDRAVKELAFDVTELSSSEFIAMTDIGTCPFVAIPVFPSKVFRHSFMCVSKKSGIKSPKDLEGRKVGVPLYTQTAAIWCRGVLEEEYGVDLSKIHWIQGAMEKPGKHGDPNPPPLLKPIDIVQNTSGKSLSDLLADGDIDATIGSRMPETWGHPNIARLIPDYREVEKEYYKRTKCHHIMHLVAIKKEIHQANPWIAQSLYDAFDAAKNYAVDNLRYSAAPRYMLPFLFSDIEEIDEVFGGDPWPYGIEANRNCMESLVRMMHNQHMISRKIPLDELFVPVKEAPPYRRAA